MKRNYLFFPTVRTRSRPDSLDEPPVNTRVARRSAQSDVPTTGQPTSEPRSYDNALRARVIAACLEERVPACKAAKRFGVSVSTSSKWVAQARQGKLTPQKRGRPRGSSMDEHADFVAALIAEDPDMTVRAMLQRLHAERDDSIRYQCFYTWLRGRGWRPGQVLPVAETEPDAAEVA